MSKYKKRPATSTSSAVTPEHQAKRRRARPTLCESGRRGSSRRSCSRAGRAKPGPCSSRASASRPADTAELSAAGYWLGAGVAEDFFFEIGNTRDELVALQTEQFCTLLGALAGP
jgi:hypothetical protein